MTQSPDRKPEFSSIEMLLKKPTFLYNIVMLNIFASSQSVLLLFIRNILLNFLSTFILLR